MVCWCGALEGACGLVCGVESRVRFFFFFSSRRRHTRLTCDWSSDVCSSDLAGPGGGGARRPALERRVRRTRHGRPVTASATLVGIDLGTTNTVLAHADPGSQDVFTLAIDRKSVV